MQTKQEHSSKKNGRTPILSHVKNHAYDCWTLFLDELSDVVDLFTKMHLAVKLLFVLFSRYLPLSKIPFAFRKIYQLIKDFRNHEDKNEKKYKAFKIAIYSLILIALVIGTAFPPLEIPMLIAAFGFELIKDVTSLIRSIKLLTKSGPDSIIREKVKHKLINNFLLIGALVGALLFFLLPHIFIAGCIVLGLFSFTRAIYTTFRKVKKNRMLKSQEHKINITQEGSDNGNKNKLSKNKSNHQSSKNSETQVVAKEVIAGIFSTVLLATSTIGLAQDKQIQVKSEIHSSTSVKPNDLILTKTSDDDDEQESDLNSDSELNNKSLRNKTNLVPGYNRDTLPISTSEHKKTTHNTMLINKDHHKKISKDCFWSHDSHQAKKLIKLPKQNLYHN